MVAWLNANAGAVLALLTLVYVVATVWLVLLTRRSIHDLRQIEQRRVRPFVVFDVVARARIMHLVLKNTGQTTAIDVCVSVLPELSRDNSASPLIGQKVAYLAPGREFADAIDSSPGFFARYSDPRFTGEVSYSDPAGARYNEPFHIDVAFQKDVGSVSRPDIARELAKIRELLERRTG